jgi:hypothetical protein
MTAPKRTYEITIAIKEGWDLIATDTLRVPVTIDLTLLQSIVNRKLDEIAMTAERIYGPPFVESETVIS